MIYTGRDCFRANCFEEPPPPAWWEDEVSTIVDAAGGRIDGRGYRRRVVSLVILMEKNVQAELVSFVVDLFDLEDETQGATKGFAREGDGLAIPTQVIGRRVAPALVEQGFTDYRLAGVIIADDAPILRLSSSPVFPQETPARARA